MSYMIASQPMITMLTILHHYTETYSVLRMIAYYGIEGQQYTNSVTYKCEGYEDYTKRYQDQPTYYDIQQLVTTRYNLYNGQYSIAIRTNDDNVEYTHSGNQGTFYDPNNNKQRVEFEDIVGREYSITVIVTPVQDTILV